jgi:hypothetical protein
MPAVNARGDVAFIAFTAKGSSVMVLSRDAGAPLVWLSVPAPALLLTPQWNADGTLVVLRSVNARETAVQLLALSGHGSASRVGAPVTGPAGLTRLGDGTFAIARRDAVTGTTRTTVMDPKGRVRAVLPDAAVVLVRPTRFLARDRNGALSEYANGKQVASRTWPATARPPVQATVGFSGPD